MARREIEWKINAWDEKVNDRVWPTRSGELRSWEATMLDAWARERYRCHRYWSACRKNADGTHRTMQWDVLEEDIQREGDDHVAFEWMGPFSSPTVANRSTSSVSMIASSVLSLELKGITHLYRSLRKTGKEDLLRRTEILVHKNGVRTAYDCCRFTLRKQEGSSSFSWRHRAEDKEQFLFCLPDVGTNSHGFGASVCMYWW